MKFIAVCIVVLTFTGCSGNDEKKISASGTIEGTDVNISAEVTGKVVRIPVDEGSRVVKGDTLLKIDDADYQIQLRQAVANEEAAEAQYRLMLEGARKEDILQAESALKNAETDFGRMKELLATGTATQKQYDDAQARFITAQQTFVKLSNGSRKEEILSARAKRDQASAQADQLRKKIRDCTILAPSNGILALKGVQEGEFVTVGANLLRLTYLDKVKLVIYVGEVNLGRVKIGQKATIGIDADEKKSFEGTVISIAQTAEFTPKNIQTKEERTKLVFAVKIQVENPEGILKPGLPADATLLTE